MYILQQWFNETDGCCFFFHLRAHSELSTSVVFCQNKIRKLGWGVDFGAIDGKENGGRHNDRKHMWSSAAPFRAVPKGLRKMMAIIGGLQERKVRCDKSLCVVLPRIRLFCVIACFSER